MFMLQQDQQVLKQKVLEYRMPLLKANQQRQNTLGKMRNTKI